VSRKKYNLVMASDEAGRPVGAQWTELPPHFTRPHRTPIRSVSRAEFEHELSQRVARYEQLYETSSAKMLTAIKDGSRVETADIAQWLFWYQLLQRLRQ
jgi:hypothetical protein